MQAAAAAVQLTTWNWLAQALIIRERSQNRLKVTAAMRAAYPEWQE